MVRGARPAAAAWWLAAMPCRVVGGGIKQGLGLGGGQGTVDSRGSTRWRRELRGARAEASTQAAARVLRLLIGGAAPAAGSCVLAGLLACREN